MLTGYGLTEATGVSTLCREGDDAETIATTSGRAIPGVDVRVVDDAKVARYPGARRARSWSPATRVTKGFFDDDGATADAFDAAGRLRTGDVGMMDARGYLRITDRMKDMFIVGGFNAYPGGDRVGAPASRGDRAGRQSSAHPTSGSARWGSHSSFLAPDAASTRRLLIAWCRERMANYKVPRRVVTVDALPTNATGKVLKYQLRERARGAT